MRLNVPAAFHAVCRLRQGVCKGSGRKALQSGPSALTQGLLGMQGCTEMSVPLSRAINPVLLLPTLASSTAAPGAQQVRLGRQNDRRHIGGALGLLRRCGRQPIAAASW